MSEPQTKAGKMLTRVAVLDAVKALQSPART